MPEWMFNRVADNWRPLLALADAAEGQWPQQARDAAATLCDLPTTDVSVGVELLRDIKAILDRDAIDKIFSADLVKKLCADHDLRWATFGGGKNNLTPRQLANLLNPYGIVPNTIRIGEDTRKGYVETSISEVVDR